LNVRWDWLERATWIIGILAALIAVPAAWATLRGLSLQVADINERENRKVAEEWKTGTIYGILTEEKAGILPFPASKYPPAKPGALVSWPLKAA
jgi:hypothetical protein